MFTGLMPISLAELLVVMGVLVQMKMSLYRGLDALNNEITPWINNFYYPLYINCRFKQSILTEDYPSPSSKRNSYIYYCYEPTKHN